MGRCKREVILSDCHIQLSVVEEHNYTRCLSDNVVAKPTGISVVDVSLIITRVVPFSLITAWDSKITNERPATEDPVEDQFIYYDARLRGILMLVGI